MPYIDYTSYVEITGDRDTPEEEVLALLGPASDVVNAMAYDRIGDGEGALERFSAPVQSAIRKATAWQLCFMSRNGGLDAYLSGAFAYTGNVHLGDFSYGNGVENAANAQRTDSRTSDRVVELLMRTGLLYSGAGRCGGG